MIVKKPISNQFIVFSEITLTFIKKIIFEIITQAGGKIHFPFVNIFYFHSGPTSKSKIWGEIGIYWFII